MIVLLIIFNIYFIPIVISGILVYKYKLNRGSTIGDFFYCMPVGWGAPLFNWAVMFLFIFELIEYQLKDIVIK